MARHGDPVVLSIEQIAKLGKQIVELGRYFETVAKDIERDGLESVETTHYKTGNDGIKKLTQFAGAIHSAHWNQRMTGSVVTEAVDSSINEAVAEEKAAVKKQQKSNRKKD